MNIDSKNLIILAKNNAMKYLRVPFNLKASNTLQVKFSKPVNIMVFIDSQFDRYKNGVSCKYFGGYQENSPYEVHLPGGYKYHLVIELGNYSKDEVKPKVKFLAEKAPPKNPVIAELDAILGDD